ncbi:MAG: chemotaxis protein CheB [SAR324 cluster bacterium]|uniref:protein-glutamate methylesterase n=1 Tax=SAR324 cluster bacterium TaxID=2024889 RepID=A0A2A4SSY6_9DELT|nr:MAG: chemotaxis protein CheB [SAR324 cluster bacterium]
MKYDAIVIGVSAGGMEALSVIFPGLPKEFPLSITVVQHRQADSDDFLIQYLNNLSPMLVKEAEEKESLSSGVVYIAPPGYHLLIEEDHSFTLSVDPPVNYARPSIDVLFESAADAFMEKLVGIVLTGASADGSLGLKKIKELGGLTLVQAPETAEHPFMPRAAVQATQIDHILQLNQISPFLLEQFSVHS